MSEKGYQAWDIDAEFAVVSSILHTGDIGEVGGILNTADFFDVGTREVYSAFLALDASNTPIDWQTVVARIKSLDRWKLVGGPKLGEMIESVAVFANVDAHAKIVADMAYQRRLTAVLSEKAAQGRSPVESVLEWGSGVEADVFKVTQHVSEVTHKDLPELVKESLADSVAAKTHGRDVNVTPTGYAALDAKMGGWVDAKLHILAGRPSMGKSALAGGFCLGVAEGGKIAIFISAEMSAKELTSRMIASKAGVDFRRYQDGQLPTYDWERVTEESGKLAKLPLAVVFKVSPTISEIRAIVRREVKDIRSRLGAELEIGLIVVDYIQILNGQKEKGESREAEVSRLSRSLMWMAGEFNAPVLALSQLNRTLESRPDKRPILSDLRESGGIEQDGYAIMFVYRDFIYTGADPDKAEIILAKNRNGKTGTVNMQFHGPSMSFIDDSQKQEDWGTGEWQ